MQVIWKRGLIAVVTLGVGVFSYTHLRLPHALESAAPGGPALENVTQENQQLQVQVSDLNKQMTDLEAQVKAAQVSDKQAQTSLSKVEKQAVALNAQLKAKQARAAQLALEQSANHRKQTIRTSTAPKVQSVTRASGSGDDDGGSNDD